MRIATVAVYLGLVLCPQRVEVSGYVVPSAEGVTVCMEWPGADLCARSDANGEWRMTAIVQGESYTVYTDSDSVTVAWDAPTHLHKLDWR